MKLTKDSALEHLEVLYKLDGIGKTASGDFVLAYDTGWAPCPPEEAAEKLANDLEAVDAIRAKICEIDDKDTDLPVPDLVLDDFVVRFDDETEYGESQAWIYLKDKTSIEVTHEEQGLMPKDQYFSVRHHCSEEDFENDVYHSTMGVIDQCAGNLAEIADMLDRLVRETGIEYPPGFCPVCGPPLRIGTASILLREVEDGEVYGVLLADGPDDAELTSAFLSAKEAVAKSDPEWQVADILARLPKEWNARVETPGSIFI